MSNSRSKPTVERNRGEKSNVRMSQPPLSLVNIGPPQTGAGPFASAGAEASGGSEMGSDQRDVKASPGAYQNIKCPNASSQSNNMAEFMTRSICCRVR